MTENVTNHKNNYREFNQIKYFENKAIDHNKKILTEIKDDLEQLDK